MSRKMWLALTSVVLVTLLTACGDLPTGQAAQNTAFTPPETIEDFEIQETIDLEELFIQTYQTQSLASQTSLDIKSVRVKLMSWSPDGQYTLLKIATGETLEGRGINDPPDSLARLSIYHLWLADRKGVPEKQLAETIAWPAWSPDSKSVAYIHREVVEGIFVEELWVTNINNNESAKLFEGAYRISWLDDHTLLFIAPGGHLQTIDVASQEVKPFRILGGPEADPKITLYELSPDRKWLVFDARGDANLSVVKIGDAGGEVMTRIATPDLSPLSWAPNGQIFAFDPRCHPQRPDPACKQIHIVQKDGALVAQIELESHTDIAWSPNSKLFLFQDNAKLYLGEVATQQIYALPLAETEFSGLAWSPDGQLITYNQTSIGGAMLLILKENQ